MSVNPNPDDLTVLVRVAVESRIKEIVLEESERAAAEVKRRIGDEIDNLALHVLKRYSMERMGSDLVIRVLKDV